MTEIIAAGIGAIAALIVWYLGARDLAKKERENKIREIRLNFLIGAYQRFEACGNRPMQHDSDLARDLESAIADIQLFGTKGQVNLAQQIARQFADEGCALFDELLNLLREDLRCELDLEKLDGRRAILRITQKKTPNTAGTALPRRS
ncbi:MAG: hypothetical protein WC701_00890 [Kiritimatiellales bacterium]|jgi:hypothetical protein